MRRARRTLRGARGASPGPTALPPPGHVPSLGVPRNVPTSESSSKEPTADLRVRVCGSLLQLLPRHPPPLFRPLLGLPSPPPCPAQCRRQAQRYPLPLTDSALSPHPFLELPGHTAFRLPPVLCLGSASRLLNPAREADPARGGLPVCTRRFLLTQLSRLLASRLPRCSETAVRVQVMKTVRCILPI